MNYQEGFTVATAKKSTKITSEQNAAELLPQVIDNEPGLKDLLDEDLRHESLLEEVGDLF